MNEQTNETSQELDVPEFLKRKEAKEGQSKDQPSQAKE